MQFVLHPGYFNNVDNLKNLHILRRHNTELHLDALKKGDVIKCMYLTSNTQIKTKQTVGQFTVAWYDEQKAKGQTTKEKK